MTITATTSECVAQLSCWMMLDSLAQPTVLGLLFASLELQHGYMRAVTPFYSKYDLEPKGNGLSQMQGETGFVADTLRKNWKKGTKYYGVRSFSIPLCRYRGTEKAQIDVVAAATASKKVTRNELASLISRWERAGYCSTKPSIVRNRYHVLKPLPKDAKLLDALADELFQNMVDKERDEVRRLRQVVEFATSDDCVRSPSSTCLVTFPH